MNRRVIVILVAILIVAGGVWMNSPTSAQALDLVNGIPPVSDSMSDIQPTLTQLKDLAPEARETYLKENQPQLERRVVYYLRQNNRIKEREIVNDVQFLFGS